MAVKLSGALSLTEIQTEFGGPSPPNLANYYRGGLYVPNGPPQNASIATSGPINMGSFYGSVRAFVFSPVISAHTPNYVLRSQAISAGWDGVTPLQATVTINSGIYVTASTTGQYAFFVGGSFPAGSSIVIINNGFIIGCGGTGGMGRDIFGNGGAGAPGGHAFYTDRAVTIVNNGVIGGGGGGGGGGGYGLVYIPVKSGTLTYTAGGGGGGGGRSGLYYPGGGGGGTTSPMIYDSVHGGTGGTGTYISQGGGGAGGRSTRYVQAKPSDYYAYLYGGNGGSGGNWGAVGGTGGSSTVGGYGGGAAGYCVVNNYLITWNTIGTRYGALV